MGAFVDQSISISSTSYYGEEDVVKWIRMTRGSYRLRHCVALIESGVGKQEDEEAS
jgi:hypothetical protein